MTNRVCRGGSWEECARFVRAAFRDGGRPASLRGALGFRLVLSRPPRVVRGGGWVTGPLTLRAAYRRGVENFNVGFRLVLTEENFNVGFLRAAYRAGVENFNVGFRLALTEEKQGFRLAFRAWNVPAVRTMLCGRCGSVMSQLRPMSELFDIWDCGWPCRECGAYWLSSDGWREEGQYLIPYRGEKPKPTGRSAGSPLPQEPQDG